MCPGDAVTVDLSPGRDASMPHVHRKVAYSSRVIVYCWFKGK